MLKKNFTNISKLVKRKSFLIILMSASLLFLLFANNSLTCFAEETSNIQKGAKVEAVQKVHKFTLDNGLEVHIIQDETFPIIAHALLYKVGSADDPKGKSGLAHYLEHLMFRSTNNTEAVSKKLQETFSNYNAMTSPYFTIYHTLVNADKLEQIMQIEADRMVNLQITETSADLERKIVLEERQLRLGNSPVSLLEEEMLAAFYRNDKSWQTVGWEHEILSLTRNDALRFYKKFYQPANAVLVLVGDIKLDQVKASINKYYGGLTNSINKQFNKLGQADSPGKVIPRSQGFARSRVLTEPPHRSDIKIYMQNSITEESVISYIFPAPNIKDEKLEATLVASYILGGTKFSKLYNELVYNLRVATEVGLDYTYWTKSLGILWLYVKPAVDGPSLEVLEQHIEKIREEILENGITTEELNTAKAKAQFDLAQYLEGVEARAIWYAISLAEGVDIGYIHFLGQKIKQVNLEQVNITLKELLKKKKVVGFLRP